MPALPGAVSECQPLKFALHLGALLGSARELCEQLFLRPLHLAFGAPLRQPLRRDRAAQRRQPLPRGLERQALVAEPAVEFGGMTGEPGIGFLFHEEWCVVRGVMLAPSRIYSGRATTKHTKYTNTRRGTRADVTKAPFAKR